MSQTKYYIFAFFVLIASHIYAQNKAEENSASENKDAKLIVINAEKEIQNGNIYTAIKLLEEALLSAENLGNKKTQGILLSKIAKLQYNIDALTDAEQSIGKAIALQTSIDDELNLALSRFVYGLIFSKQKKYNKALEYFKSSKTIFEEQTQNKLYTEVTLNEAIAHIGLDNLNEANVLLTETIQLSEENNFKSLLATALITSGSIDRAQNNYKNALIKTLKGSKIANNNGDLEVLNESYSLLSNIYSETKEHELANKNLRLFIALQDSILKNVSILPQRKAQLTISDKNDAESDKNDAESDKNDAESDKNDAEKNEAGTLGKLTTVLSIGMITILSLLTLSLYKNNNIRQKTNNILYKKNTELLTEKERAEIAAIAKSNFLSTVTHELRTPLYAVTGLTKMLLEEDPKPEQIQHLKSLKFSGDYLLTFINDILQINKIEANKVELDPEIFNLKQKVENVISALNNSALDNNIVVTSEYDKSLPEVFDGDQLKISQILINLIGNSIKFTKDGNIWVRILKIKQKQDKYIIRFEVEDNGIGITKEKQKNMFESFSQGSVQINRKYGGTGLGLSIVKGLVDILKGKINLKSELGKGTIFSVDLPLKESKETIIIEKTELFKDIDALELEKINILIVEDNKINQMITRKILSKMKLHSEIVDNGEDAVDLIRKNKYDIVLMDIHMPGISGIEATKIVRGFDKEITIFALTAVTIEDKMQEFDDAGFDAIISKPFKQEDFEKEIFSALFKDKSPVSV